MLTYLDTHSALWLFYGAREEFSVLGLAIVDSDELRISPMVLFEIAVLQEAGRIRNGPEEIRATLLSDYQIPVCPIPFHQVAEAAYAEKWTRDPFDRLIVAHAKAAKGRLLTRDRRIHANFSGAVW